MLIRSPKKSRAYSADDRVNDERKDRAREDRQQCVRHFEKHPEKRSEELAAEVCGEIRGDESSQSPHLPRQAAPPAPQNFEYDQNERERNKDELPKRRTC